MPRDKTHLKPTVIAELRKHGNMSRAARAAEISLSTIKLWRRTDARFLARSDEAIQAARY